MGGVGRNPCLNGDCHDQINGWECECAPGWSGLTCDTNIDDCSADPYVHGTCSDGIDSLTCECDQWWLGTVCDEPACPCQIQPEWAPFDVGYCGYEDWAPNFQSIIISTNSGYDNVYTVQLSDSEFYCGSDSTNGSVSISLRRHRTGPRTVPKKR